MNILDAMMERRSVRNFDGEPISAEQKQLLIDFADSVSKSSPLHGGVTIRLKEFDIKNGFRPSTYGTITGACNFFLVAIDSEPMSALAAGYIFEQVVLKATCLNLGTCWIAATFKGTDFDHDTTWPSGQQLRIICPIGLASKQSLRAKITRFACGSSNRKQAEKLFFFENFSSPLPTNNRFFESLDMLRRAPSSVNSQPWRALVIDSSVHFYYKPKSNLSILDCGIGLCHFHETEKFRGSNGTFSIISSPPSPPDDWQYLISYNLP